MKKILTCLLAGTLVLGTASVRAARTEFPDVDDGHWAEGYIQELAEGGLVKGYENGCFGPENPLGIDELAMVIASARGICEQAETDYWARRVVGYCQNQLECLPDLGTVTEAHYGVPCTRELAFHMLTKGLGKGLHSTAPEMPELTPESIPDLDAVDEKYRDSVLEAYRLGLCNGMDQTGRFAPDTPLTRAQMTAILSRAGWTQLGQAGPRTDGVRSCAGLMELIAAQEGWQELQKTGHMWMLMNTDPGVGEIYVALETDSWGETRLNIRLNQRTADRGLGPCSAYGYEGRSCLYDLLALCFPESAETVRGAVREAFLQQRWDSPARSLPNALLWTENRLLAAGYGAGDCFTLTVGEEADSLPYRKLSRGHGLHQAASYGELTPEEAEVQFELDRWPDQAA